MIIFSAYFEENDVQKTGLSPTPVLTVRKLSDNSIVLNSVSMVEVGDGWYKYEWSGEDNTESYVGSAYESSLTSGNYAPVCTTVQGEVSDIKVKTDTIDWSDITALTATLALVKTSTDTIDWNDINTIIATLAVIQAQTDTINWSAITTIDANIDTIKAVTDTIDWSEIAAIKTVVDAIQASTDTINWADVTAISALCTAIKAKTDTIAWADITFIRAIQEGNWAIESNQMIFYETDGVTVLATYNLFDSSGDPAMEQVYKREIV